MKRAHKMCSPCVFQAAARVSTGKSCTWKTCQIRGVCSVQQLLALHLQKSPSLALGRHVKSEGVQCAVCRKCAVCSVQKCAVCSVQVRFCKTGLPVRKQSSLCGHISTFSLSVACVVRPAVCVATCNVAGATCSVCVLQALA